MVDEPPHAMEVAVADVLMVGGVLTVIVLVAVLVQP